MDEIVVDMSEDKGEYRMGQAYVGLSCVRTFEKLHIINYSWHQIRASRKVHREMRHLRKDSNRLAPLPKPVIMEAHQNKVCIGHLNVQSLGSKTMGKYLDILNETDLQLVDVLCITETHLKKDEQVSCNNFLKCKEGCFQM